MYPPADKDEYLLSKEPLVGDESINTMWERMINDTATAICEPSLAEIAELEILFKDTKKIIKCIYIINFE